MSTPSDPAYGELCHLLQRRTGIALGESRSALVLARLSGRMRALGDTTLEKYLSRVNRDQDEVQVLINLLSTNVTSFFREAHHFEYLAQEFLPRRLAENDPDTIRIWSAACSSGQEPYSIAMTLADQLGEDRLNRFLVLATDISTKVLAQTKQAVYPESDVASVSKAMKLRFFERGSGGSRVSANLRGRVRPRQLNLLERWPMRKSFDVIFCRNALIYFEREVQARLARRFFDQLRPGGLLFIGHSESLNGLEQGFEYLEPTIYRRPSNQASVSTQQRVD